MNNAACLSEKLTHRYELIDFSDTISRLEDIRLDRLHQVLIIHLVQVSDDAISHIRERFSLE